MGRLFILIFFVLPLLALADAQKLPGTAGGPPVVLDSWFQHPQMEDKSPKDFTLPLVFVLLSAASIAVTFWKPSRLRRSIGLLSIFVSTFGLMATVIPLKLGPNINAVLFFWLILTFVLLGKFETA